MTGSDVAHRLFDFLDQHAFKPVLSARPESYSEAQREILRSAQADAQRVRARLDAHTSAAELYRSFHEVLASADSRRLHARLHELGLPALDDVRIDFEQMASDLGIGTSGAL